MAAPFRGRGGSAAKNYQLSLGAAVAFVDTKGPNGEFKRKLLDAGENSPGGVRVWYWLKDKSESEVTLTFMDADGVEIKSYSSRERDKDDESEDSGDPRVSAEAGMNKFDWNIRYPGARKVPGDKTTEGVGRGPLAPPGSYQVQVERWRPVADTEFSRWSRTRASRRRRRTSTPQFELLLRIRDKMSETHDNINRLRSARSQVEEWAKRAEGTAGEDAVTTAADALKEKLNEVEGALIQTEYKGARDRLHMPIKLNAKLAGLTPVVSAADFRPPQQTYDVFAHFSEVLDGQFGALERVLDEDLDEFQNLLAELEVPSIVPRASE